MRLNKSKAQISRILWILMTTCTLIWLFIAENMMNMNEFLSKFVFLSYYINNIIFIFSPKDFAKNKRQGNILA